MSATSTPTPAPALRRESPWRRNLTEFLSSKTAVFEPVRPAADRRAGFPHDAGFHERPGHVPLLAGH
ncbi:hypothetical protein G6F31_021011 [Rhizopus arrhizus]|nr:hypothetical protein G6F31_021011 [Rhizopus arrhizus]